MNRFDRKKNSREEQAQKPINYVRYSSCKLNRHMLVACGVAAYIILMAAAAAARRRRRSLREWDRLWATQEKSQFHGLRLSKPSDIKTEVSYVFVRISIPFCP